MSETRFLQAYLEASRLMVRQSDTFELPVNVMATFLTAAIYSVGKGRPGEPVMSLEELADKVGCSPSTISNQLRYLGREYRNGKAGLGWIKTYPHPENGRKKMFALTHRGTEIAYELEIIFYKAVRKI